MNNLIKSLVFGGSMLITSLANAGELINSATVTSVANVASNIDQFVIYFSGGTGVCTTQDYIIFPADAAISKEAHNRAYSLVLTALTTGMKVKIHNYESNACDRATFVQVSK
ncbi:MAG: DUF5992 family protein [Psychrosphaera sp.]|nr:DUF5992 family protein [Psychrosphaera sp.]